jgi:hypothetical protein
MSKRALAIVLALLGAMPLAAHPAGASTGSSTTTTVDREVHGTVAIPTGLPRQEGNFTRCTGAMAGITGTYTIINSVTPGANFSLTADAGTWAVDFDISFYASGPICGGSIAPTAVTPPLPYQNSGGDEHGVVPSTATFAVVTLLSPTPNQAFTYQEFTQAPVGYRTTAVKPTVVAVIEPVVAVTTENPNGFSPYHLDFTGAQFPWNTDTDPANDIDFNADPSPWLPGYPGATPVQLTLPTSPTQDVSTLHAQDAAAWSSMQASTLNDVHLYRLTGTKIIGAAAFSFPASSPVQLDSPTIYSKDNLKAHGTQTSSVAAGNIHGTCPDCLLVLLRGDANAAMKWATQQPWIDVISNSYSAAEGFPTSDPSGEQALHDGVVSGQTITWSAGNGADASSFVPALDYFDYRPGSDWVVTVSGTTPFDDQPDGSSKPADVAATDAEYPSAGGTTAGGSAQFAGTSNSAPLVAGVFGEALTKARMLLGDTTPGHASGVVAQGTPRPCDGGLASCPLDDGVLTRAELQQAVFDSVYPSPVRYDGVAPNGPNSVTALETAHPIPPQSPAASEGHGVIHGRLSPDRYDYEVRSYVDLLRGEVAPGPRPPGEHEWLVTDSMCRQQLWGQWDGGEYHAGDPEPAFDSTVDPTTAAATQAWWTWCSALPPGAGDTIGSLV